MMWNYVYQTVVFLALLTECEFAACPINCNSCDELDHCTSCKNGTWGLDIGCQNTCYDNCLNQECDVWNGNCIACKSELYGVRCQHNCNLCESGLCDLLACTKGCKPGYYEFPVFTETLCLPCLPNCRSCKDNKACTICNDGFYLYEYEGTGKNVMQCIECQNGINCSSACAIQNCKQCEVQNESLLCTQCNNGYSFNDDICIPYEVNCAQGCSTDCDKEGICLGSCISGWTGERCLDACAAQCLRCDKSNATICQECKGGYYSPSCDVPCNSSCMKVIGKQTCRLNDGYCLNGCENKFWGQFCNQSCSAGCVDDKLNHVCDRNNGTCNNGCVDGYSGDTCETDVSKETTVPPEERTNRSSTRLQTDAQVTTIETTTQSDTSENVQEVKGNGNMKFIIGYISGFGTAVVLAFVAAALFCLRRRSVSKKSKTINEGTADTEISTCYNETAEQTPVPERTDSETIKL